MINRDTIIQEILSEREYQDNKWGGEAHDDTHQSHDWVAFIIKHMGKAITWPWDGERFRAQMIRVAALALAAVEWYDRGNMK